MFIGASGRPARERGSLASGSFPADGDGAVRWVGAGDAVAAVRPWGVATLDAEERIAQEPGSGSWLVLSGHLYRDLAGGCDVEPGRGASLLLQRLAAGGPDAIADFDGTFAAAWFDGRARRLHLFRDAFGVEPLFYAPVSGGVAFASRVRDLARTGLLPGGIAPQGLAEYLTYCFVPSESTLDRGVLQLPPATRAVFDAEGRLLERRRYYRVSFAGPPWRDEREFADRYRDLLEAAVLRRAGVERLGAFVSGGMDSSSIVTFLRRHRSGPIHSFSYRCAGKSFDESVYARALTDAMETEHTEKEYGEGETLRIEAAAAQMEVPFSDIGLEIGSWLLGTAAEKRVDVIMTGDGGDEMWASHPVYAAERLVSRVERAIPGAMTRGLQRLAERIPDSDQKRDLRVKLKRILPPAGIPQALGPWRWRAYYERGALRELLVPELAEQVEACDPFAPVLASYEGYDGPRDGLSPHIASDYTGLTPYYFYRLTLLRHFGLEVRCPFYDRALVEHVAKLPADRKLEGLERTKRLFRLAMEGVLPDVINHRKDKLGHSIPFKNWLREDGVLAARVAELCSPQSIRARGLFRPEAVARLLEEHRSRRHNRSHRIWALAVLELWLRAREAQW
jgi:asparagine synthase (glutamine-hydrolysing)